VGGKRILEIGAGLDRTAYYAQKLSAIAHTVIDIPLTQVAQGYIFSDGYWPRDAYVEELFFGRLTNRSPQRAWWKITLDSRTRRNA
jgi:hypothetical protein